MTKPRTLPQNKALHKWCQEIADTLNECGVSVAVYLEHVEVDHTMETVKSLFRAIGKEKFGIQSTAELTESQFRACIDEIHRHNANFGITMDFPSRELENFYQNYIN